MWWRHGWNDWIERKGDFPFRIPAQYTAVLFGSQATMVVRTFLVRRALLRTQKALAVVGLRRYLVDPASYDMLVSRTKPCMCKYKPLYGETANGSLKQL